MQFTRFNIVSVLLVILAVVIMVGRIFDCPQLSNYAWIGVFPLLTYLYYCHAKGQNNYFGFFLIAFSIVEFLKIIFDTSNALAYYAANCLNIVAYASLIIFLVKGIKLKRLFREFKLHLIILLIFNAYIIYVLNQMIMQDDDLAVNSIDFIMEVTYNVLILLVLSLSLIHYLYHDTKQGLLLFLASVCIVFSEMVQVAYLFISSEQLLHISYSVLMGLGFYFLYVYIKIKHTETNETPKKVE
ncbi:hypothetical protein [Olleya sp. HaHaR_3_96]|uniref:hypothetical protein n=1 Tax=Olleya sp. HaHaR_3_96 TaxID=2745560 RepID=UPI001C4E9010|nr:hypothetical protein [Olleya sp. HaHaR_3_96]QXP58233.1 hypothetical protein H0I26_09885 [Olleya sp. HaHaR_3_96]